jgi:crotonobetainyl-CoA:carnitine CoA-transferase CaiB-like acyl-CoA transferase
MSEDGLLSEITILDLTQGAGGPFCTKLLADYGARVIKVERPGRGDPARRVGPFADGSTDAGALFLYLNTGKESITLDITTATGRALLLDLVEHVDALEESAPAGVLGGAGLGIEALHQRNPRLIVTSVSTYGRSGPYAGHLSSDVTAIAAGGLMSITGNPDREPLMTAGHQAAYQSGAHAFGATLAGLYSVGVIERGQHIDIAAMECLASTLELYLGDYVYNGREILTKRRGNALSPLISLYPCADGMIGVHVMSRNFASFARLIEEPWMIEDERFQTEISRLTHGDELSARVYAWAGERTRAQIYERAGEERTTIAPILNVDEVLDHPHMRERGSFGELDDKRTGPLRYPGPPFRPGAGEWELRPAPRLGEHNDAVYGDMLGLRPVEIARLRAAGVV